MKERVTLTEVEKDGLVLKLADDRRMRRLVTQSLVPQQSGGTQSARLKEEQESETARKRS